MPNEVLQPNFPGKDKRDKELAKKKAARDGPQKRTVMLKDVAVGIVLIVLLILWVPLFVTQIFVNPAGLLPLMLVALVLGFLLFVWINHDHQQR